jgi:hypothetical protein
MTGEVAVCGGNPTSVTRMLTLNWPAVVGVPLMVPLFAFRFSPGGRLPVAIAKV